RARARAMPNAIPAFFRASPAAASGSGAGAGPSLATSVYETRLGLAALSWSRAAFGLSLRAVLRVGALASSSSASDYGCYDDGPEFDEETTIAGERVLHIRRLRWKFRGSEKVDFGGGDRVQVSWDLHNWLFSAREPALTDAASVLAAASPPAHAVFVFRFELGDTGGGEERDTAEAKEKELLDKARRGGAGVLSGYLGRWGRGDWSETSSNGENRRKRGQARRLAKASSSSSASIASSSASWASSSTVMDWASPEEAELHRGDGFSLLVYAWKS
uniref:DUF868 domain-containing protein n=1 Tax=Aegilops tauschii subsp. strangulata TaxID=200361 RepID=A0A453KXA9_AEGTS